MKSFQLKLSTVSWETVKCCSVRWTFRRRSLIPTTDDFPFARLTKQFLSKMVRFPDQLIMVYELLWQIMIWVDIFFPNCCNFGWIRLPTTCAILRRSAGWTSRVRCLVCLCLSSHPHQICDGVFFSFHSTFVLLKSGRYLKQWKRVRSCYTSSRRILFSHSLSVVNNEFSDGSSWHKTPTCWPSRMRTTCRTQPKSLTCEYGNIFTLLQFGPFACTLSPAISLKHIMLNHVQPF